MKSEISIRKRTVSDLPALENLYPAAFPEEDLLPVVRDLLSDDAPVLSLVAVLDAAIIGHIAFTFCTVDQTGPEVALLAPLGVSPEFQKRGIGSQLVKSGFDLLKAQDVDLVLVLGDPCYYSRLGFQMETGVKPPYPLPEEWAAAWQSVSLGSKSESAGDLVVPSFWQNPAYWSE